MLDYLFPTRYNVSIGIKVYNKQRNFRCSCCNKVASEDIASDIFEWDSRLFFKEDLKDRTRILCSECIDIINATVSEFEETTSLDEDE